MTFKPIMKTLARIHQVWFIRMWETVVGQLKVCYNMVDCLQGLSKYCKVPYIRFLYPKGIEQQPDGEEEEAIYSEADDGRPKPIPVANFAKYFKKSSENGAIVLRQEYKVRRWFFYMLLYDRALVNISRFFCVLFLFAIGDLVFVVDFVARVSKSDLIESFLIKAHVLQLSIYLSQNLQGDMLFPCGISKSNRGKNRYGNIVACECM